MNITTLLYIFCSSYCAPKIERLDANPWLTKIMSNPCACDRDYDSDTGAMHDYVCDWCSCDQTSECQRHAADFDRVKDFYYEMLGVETLESHLHLQYDLLRRICTFVQERLDVVISHPDIRHAVADSLYALLEEPVAAPLYDLFRETLALIDA